MTYAMIAGIVFLAGTRRPLEIALLPLIVLSGWAFFGHLITLDDDASGGWSNPERSAAAWRTSLIQLCIKGIAFAVIVALVAWSLGWLGASNS
jgi:hypothetical protein